MVAQAQLQNVFAMFERSASPRRDLSAHTNAHLANVYMHEFNDSQRQTWPAHNPGCLLNSAVVGGTASPTTSATS